MDINITVTEIIAESTISETVITCDVVMSMESDVDKAYVDNQLDLKVDKVDGKGLSTNDYTNEEKNSLANKVDKVANHSLVPDSEIDKLSEYPELLEETTNKVISDTGELVSIPTPSGGYANNLYLGETDSDVAGYKILTYIADTAETIKTITANSSAGVVTAQTFLYPTGVSVSNFPSGLWSLKLWGNISASAGVSQVGFTYFKRSVAGVETDLFTLWSEEVNNTSDIWIDVIGTQPSYLVDPTDRMGLRLLFKTTSVTNKTLTYSIGDGYAAFVNNPNQIRHSQTRDKNGESAVQHVDTTTTKPTLAEADKVAILDSVTNKLVLTPKNNFGSQLLVDYTHTANKEVNVQSIDFATSVITAPNHGLANNTQLFIANKLAANVLYPVAVIPNGLNTGTKYFVVNKTDNTFQVSLTSGGGTVAITDKASKNYASWHFETFSTVNITNLPNLKKCKIETFGKSFNELTSANYTIFKKLSAFLFGITDPNWVSTGGIHGTGVSNTARTILHITSFADVFSTSKIEIDFSLPRALIKLNVVRCYSATNTTNSQLTYTDWNLVHKTDGNIDFDEFQIGGVFNGFNIKIYSA